MGRGRLFGVVTGYRVPEASMILTLSRAVTDPRRFPVNLTLKG